MLRIYIQSQITGVLAQGVRDWWSRSTAPIAPGGAGGGVASSGNMIASFAKGSTGIMGESGPEAIMPLTRLPGGDLGVKVIMSANAKGNVYESPSLSAYSNQVVDNPTFFSFAHGRGIMGEAGPEAIMPLTRLPGGDLGVKSVPDKTTPVSMSVHIHEAPGTQTRTEMSEDGTNLNIIIEQVEQAMTGRMDRGTGMAPFMDSRYARTY